MAKYEQYPELSLQQWRKEAIVSKEKETHFCTKNNETRKISLVTILKCLLNIFYQADCSLRQILSIEYDILVLQITVSKIKETTEK